MGSPGPAPLPNSAAPEDNKGGGWTDNQKEWAVAGGGALAVLGTIFLVSNPVGWAIGVGIGGAAIVGGGGALIYDSISGEGATSAWLHQKWVDIASPIFGGEGDVRLAELRQAQFENLVSQDGPFHAKGKEVTREEYIEYLEWLSDPIAGTDRLKRAQMNGDATTEALLIIEFAKERAEFARQMDPAWVPDAEHGEKRMSEDELQAFAERQMHAELRNVYEQEFLRKGMETPDAMQEWVLRSKDVTYISKFLGISEDAARAYKTDIMLNWLEEDKFMFGRKPKINYLELYAALVNGEDPDQVYGRIHDQFRFQEQILKLVTGFIEKFLGGFLDKLGLNIFKSPVNDMDLLKPEIPSGMTPEQFAQQVEGVKQALDGGVAAKELAAMGIDISALEKAGLGDQSIASLLQKAKANALTAEQEEAFQDFLAANASNPVFSQAVTQSNISSELMNYLQTHGGQGIWQDMQKSMEVTSQHSTAPSVESYTAMIQNSALKDYQGFKGLENLSSELQGLKLQELINLHNEKKLSYTDELAVAKIIKANAGNAEFVEAVRQLVNDGTLVNVPQSMIYALNSVSMTPVSTQAGVTTTTLPEHVMDEAVMAGSTMSGGVVDWTGAPVATDVSEVALPKGAELAPAPSVG